MKKLYYISGIFCAGLVLFILLTGMQKMHHRPADSQPETMTFSGP